MAVDNICAGLTGMVNFDGTEIRCNSFTFTVEQKPLFYNNIFGLRDTQTGNETIKEEDEVLAAQRTVWRPGPILYKANMQFPLTETKANIGFEAAKRGSSVSLDMVASAAGPGVKIEDGRISSWSLTATAGDIYTCTIDVTAINATVLSTIAPYSNAEKLLTWDMGTIIADDIDDPIKSFTLAIKNEVFPIYTAKNNITRKMAASVLRMGTQVVNGSISYYKDGPGLTILKDSTDTKVITCNVDNLSITSNVIFVPFNFAGAIGPVIVTMPFEGTGFALGE